MKRLLIIMPIVFLFFSFSKADTTFITLNHYINSDTTWTLAGSPYVISANVTIAIGVQLTIEPGVVVLSDRYDRDFYVNGTLRAQGNDSTHIIFTKTTAASYWGHFLISPGGSLILDYCDLSYGGGGMIRADSAGTIDIRHCSFSDQWTSGAIIVTKTLSGSTIQSCTFTNFTNVGGPVLVLRECSLTLDSLTLTANSGTAAIYSESSNLTITNSTITDNAGDAINVSYIPGAIYNLVNVTGSTINGSVRSDELGTAILSNDSLHDIELNLSMRSTVSSNNIFTGTHYISFKGGISGLSKTLPKLSSQVYQYHIDDYWYVDGPLTIGAGVEIIGGAGDSIYVSKTLDVYGSAAWPTRFTSVYLDIDKPFNSGPATFSYCIFDSCDVNLHDSATANISHCTFNTTDATFDSSTVTLANSSFTGGKIKIRNPAGTTAITACTLSTAQNSADTSIFLTNVPSATLDSLVLNAGSAHGIVLSNSSPTISNSTISGYTNTGIYCSNSSNPLVRHNTISGNTSFGMQSTSSGIDINAEMNYWGNNSGPYHAARNPSGSSNAVSDYIDFRPWTGGDTIGTGPVTAITTTAYTKNSITVSWTTPSDADYKATIIRFSTSAFPASLSDGTLLKIDSTTALNTQAGFTHTSLDSFTPYFYSFFTYDTSENYGDSVSTLRQYTGMGVNYYSSGSGSPANNAANISLSTTLSWPLVTHATSYVLQLSLNSDFSTTLIDTNVILSSSLAVSNLSSYTNYYWRVRGYNDTAGVYSDWFITGNTFRTVPPAPANAPALASPSNGAINQNLTTAFYWDTVMHATAYRLQVATDSAFSTPIFDTTKQSTIHGLEGLSFGTTYYWRVNASNDSGTSAWSDVWNCTTIPAIPEIPTLVWPAEGDTNISLSPTLIWQSSARATSYYLILKQLYYYSSQLTIVNDSNLTDTTYTVSGLSNTKYYQWTVRAKNVTGSSSWSQEDTFLTVPIPPSAPSMDSPWDGETNVSLNPAFSWGSVYDATGYHIQLAVDSSFSSSVINDSGLTTTTDSANGLSSNTTYYWRLRASNAGGWSPWSDIFSFITMPPVPGIPQLAAPNNDTTSIKDTVKFIWHPVTGATQYNCQYSTDSIFAGDLVTKPNLTDTTVTVVLTKGTQYYWRVNAKNTAGTGEYSAAWRFTTIIAAPSYPQVVSPASYSTQPADSVKFIWNTKSRATSYRMQLSNSISFSDLLHDTDNITDTSLSIYGLNHSSTYYWRVNASNAGGTSSWSSAPQFTTYPLPPDAPTLSSPADSAVDISTSPTLSWNAVSGATWYRLQVSIQSDFSTTVYDNNTLTETSAGITALANDTQYFWRVRARNTGGDGPWSLVRTFTTVSAPVEPPWGVTLLSPSSSETGVSVSPTMTWSSSSLASSYSLQIATDAVFTNPVLDTSNLTDTSSTFTLSFKTQYFWRVSAQNGAGSSDWSSWMDFTTREDSARTPTLVSPSSGDTNVPISTAPVLVWNTGTNASSYSVQISTEADFSTLFLDQSSLTDTSRTAGGLSYSTTYYWRVRSHNSTNTSAWSDTFSFVTQDPTPWAPTLVSPSASETNVPVTRTFIWSAAQYAGSYRLQIDTSGSFTAPLIDTAGLIDTTHAPAGLQHGTKYYWRVGAANSSDTTWVSSTYFTTIVDTPAAPTLASPADSSLNVSSATQLSWNASNQAQYYRVQVSSTSDFSAIVLDEDNVYDTLTLATSLSYSTVYYWQVMAKNIAGNSDWSSVWTFTTAVEPPDTPTAIFPGFFASDISKNPALLWGSAARAVTYHLQVATDGGFLSLVYESDSLTDTSQIITGLQASTSYSWRIRAANAGGAGAWSSTAYFTTITEPPAAPSLESPLGTATDVATNVTLSWTTVTGASSYGLQMSTSDDFSNPIVDTAGFATNSYAVSNLSNSTIYYWRVKASNSAGTSDWSMARSFTTAAAPVAPDIPSLISPLASATDIPITISLVWSAVSGAISYQFQVSTNADFSNYLVNNSSADTSYALSALTEGTSYHWRVKASGAAAASEWSTSQTFTTIPATPSAPSLISPLENAQSVAVPIVLSWSSVVDAQNYRLQVGNDPGFSNIVEDTAGISTTSVTFATLASNTTFYWRVSAINTGGSSGWSVGWAFTTAAVLASPTPVSPSDNAQSISLPTVFSWSAVGGAQNYRLQISNDMTFDNIIKDTAGITANSYAIAGLAYSSTYYWRTRATSGTDSSDWSAPWAFTTSAEPPPAPALVSPADKAGSVAIDATLSWSAITGAQSYRLQVGTDSTFATNILMDSPNLTTASSAVESMVYNTAYYWRINATRSGVSSVWSTTGQFTTIIAPPSAPMLSSPLPNAQSVAVATAFSWLSVAGAESYQMQVSTDMSFSTGLRDSAGITATSVAIAGLEHTTTYNWRVRAFNSGGTGGWSAPRSFTTVLAPPDTPALVSPGLNTVNVPTSTSLVWGTAARASSYRLQVSTVSDFAAIIIDTDSLMDTTYSISALENDRQYYWRIRAMNEGGVSNWSSLVFTTIVMLPEQIIPLSPANNITLDSESVHFVWNASQPDVNRYQLDVSIDSMMTNVIIDSMIADTLKTMQLSPRTYWWRVRAYNAAGWGPYCEKQSFTVVGQLTSVLPKSFSFSFISMTSGARAIRYALPKEAHVFLKLLTLQGRNSSIAIDGMQPAGYYTVDLPKGRLANGSYILLFKAGNLEVRKRFTLFR